jgi:predicted Zn-dependent peptidase
MNLKRLIFLILLPVLITVNAQDRKIEFTEYNLQNGLHVILHQDNSTPIVAVTVTYHVGSKNEQPNRTGFAHFFEHLMFEGSDNIKRGEIDNLIQNAGGELNAHTSFDETSYYFLLPSNQLELGLWIESERMMHAKIDSAGVETQRKVVKEERKQSIDNRPYGSFMEQIFSHAYKVHPYRWTPIGSVQYIDQATIKEFREFYKSFYVPNNAVLSIAGDIDIEQTKSLIDKYFSEIKKGAGEIYRPKLVEPKQTVEVRDTVWDNIQLPAVIEAYHIPAQGTNDYYALDMLTNLLSNGESSRLYKELIDNQRLAVAVGSFPFSLENPGLFVAYAISSDSYGADTCEYVINKEFEKVKNELISEEEFQKIRNQTESDFISEKNKVLGIAQSLAIYYLFFGDTNLINTELERYMKVTREDLKRVANEYLTEGNRVVLYYLPKNNKDNE